jgi:protein-S-isoprenylcysteine O-methyltransferase Ste14
MIFGAAMTVFDAHGFVQQCGVMDTNVRWVLIPWVVMLVYTVLALCSRGSVEDERLRKEFGMSWEGYRREVPCRFIPGII